MAKSDQAIIRPIFWKNDGKQLSDFDASFSTERIYRVSVNEMSVEITEGSLNVPFRKTYRLDCVRDDVEAADYAVAAEISGVVVGFATVKYEEWNKRAVLSNLYVDRESRGKGVGRLLIDAVIDYAKTTPARCLWLETQNVNYPAIQFYTGVGFQLCGFDSALYDPADVSSDETALYFCRFV